MSNQHKHADLIHAWADGAKIQYFSKKHDKWVTVTNPSWDEDKDYRIKLQLEDWQKHFIDAIKDGATVEFQLGGNWHTALLNDIADDREKLSDYNWMGEDRYRIKPTETQQSIELEGMLLIGTRQDENGEDVPYLKTVPLDLSVAAGDSINFKYTFGE